MVLEVQYFKQVTIDDQCWTVVVEHSVGSERLDGIEIVIVDQL